MSDEPTPQLRALAVKLFAAGRAERPGPALGRRLALIAPLGDAAVKPSPQSSGARPGTRNRIAFWLSAETLTTAKPSSSATAAGLTISSSGRCAVNANSSRAK